MTLSLTRELERFIKERVKSGRYPTAQVVIAEGLRLLDERDRLYQLRLGDLRREIRKGLASGRATAFNPGSLKKKVRHAKHR